LGNLSARRCASPEKAVTGVIAYAIRVSAYGLSHQGLCRPRKRLRWARRGNRVDEADAIEAAYWAGPLPDEIRDRGQVRVYSGRAISFRFGDPARSRKAKLPIRRRTLGRFVTGEGAQFRSSYSGQALAADTGGPEEPKRRAANVLETWEQSQTKVAYYDAQEAR
jgi:hypothetical protein